MTDLDDLIARLRDPQRQLKFWGRDMAEAAAALEALRDEVARKDAAVALEWRSVPFHNDMTADHFQTAAQTPFGFIVIHDMRPWLGEDAGFGFSYGQDGERIGLGEISTESEAKERAEADYNRRLRAALKHQ